MATLVQELFDGAIDIVGDVHGEIQALEDLMARLGYEPDGRHPQGRRLVFVGDLGDRGPDSPGVVLRLRDMVQAGRAQCVLGNHDFNALWATRGGRMKPELCWLFDEAPLFRHYGIEVPQKKVRGKLRDEVLAFFASLPIVLQRPDVRVVHASWDDDLVEQVRHETDAVEVYFRRADRIERALVGRPGAAAGDGNLAHQNDNPVKRLTSGLEGRSPTPIVIGGKPRWERRVPWWESYQGPLVVFGHYWRQPLPWDREESLFDGQPLEALLPGPSMCIDYSVGKRFKERLQADFKGRYRTWLGALRLPERVLVFDRDLEPRPVIGP